MHAFMDELEARFDEVRGRELEELIDELTDAERASVTLSARLAGADGLVNLSLRGGSVVVDEVLDSTLRDDTATNLETYRKSLP